MGMGAEMGMGSGDMGMGDDIMYAEFVEYGAEEEREFFAEEEIDEYWNPQMYNGVMYYTESDYNAAVSSGNAGPVFGGVGIPFQMGIMFEGVMYNDESSYNAAIGGGGGAAPGGGGGGASDGIAGSDTSVMYASGVTTTGTSSDDTIIVGTSAGGSIVNTGLGADLLHHDIANGNYEWSGLHNGAPINPGISGNQLPNSSWYGFTNESLLSGGTTNYAELNMVSDFQQGTDKIEISNSAAGLEAGYNHIGFVVPALADQPDYDHGTVLSASAANTAVDTYFNAGYNVSGSAETGVTILYIAGTSEMLFGIAGDVTLTDSDFFNSVA
jgi:hypothetical protein